MEAEKREERNTETKETEQHEDYIHTVLFAAGTTLLVACLKRAVMVSFVEQWRAWVFLVLNLVLLAILFISLRPSISSEQESNCTVEFPIERKKRRKQCRRLVAVEECRDCCKLYKSGSRMNEGERVEDGAELRWLSKEELNERVEAFIAMLV